MKVKLLSHVQLLATPWTAAYQAPPSMEFSVGSTSIVVSFLMAVPLTGLVAATYLGGSALVDGEGNGTPLQYSCLENPMDGGAWKAAVRGVAEGRA